MQRWALVGLRLFECFGQARGVWTHFFFQFQVRCRIERLAFRWDTGRSIAWQIVLAQTHAQARSRVCRAGRQGDGFGAPERDVAGVDLRQPQPRGGS